MLTFLIHGKDTVMSEKHMYFNGVRFTRDDRTGYYLSSRKTKGNIRQRMHVYVWEHYNGPVPEGYHVHHIDGDKSHNYPKNLELLERSEHLSLHGCENAVLHHAEMVENLRRNAIPKSKIWHSTETGKAWHKAHYEQMKDKLYVEHDFICQNCGKGYKSVQTSSKFCSNNCRAAWRRKSGVDDIVRSCKYCGRGFVVNKYAKKEYCSKKCACKMASQTRKIG